MPTGRGSRRWRGSRCRWPSGPPRQAGVLVVGTNLPAVDATATRLMGLDPWRIGYLAAASGLLGPIAEAHIAQRGERIATLAQKFQVLGV
ncbi:MAG: hypothetical protein LC745_11450 [Planctomycetia bacterium]|nr:hypothetical protein [Planctomycetia bacterium]